MSFHKFLPFWRLFSKFQQKLVGVHIVLFTSLLMLGLLFLVSLLLLTLWCSYCLSCCGLFHAVSGFTVFERIPAFDGVHAVLAVLSIWSICYCWRSLCNHWCVGVSAVPSNMLLLVVLLSLAFLLLNFLAVASFPADPGAPILAGGFVEWDILHYGTIGIWLSNCNFFLLSNDQNIYCNIVLANSRNYQNLRYGSRPQSIRLSDIRFRKNYRLRISVQV